jgi:hypothetical protein
MAGDSAISPALAYQLFVSNRDDDQSIKVGFGVRRGDRFLGDESFLREEREATLLSASRDFPRWETHRPAPSLSELLDSARVKRERNRQIRRAHAEFGYQLIDIAGHLGLHPGSVSRILRTHQR